MAECRRWFLAGLAALVAGCRIEALHDLEIDDANAISLPPPPFIPTVDGTSQPTVGWEAIVRQHLTFLTGPLAAGRRPGTDGARLTQRLAVATFSEAGLIPDGSDRTWTQTVPIEVVSNHRVQMSTELKNDAGESSSFSLDAGIYVRRNGISSPYRAELELVRVAPESAEAVAPELSSAVAGKLVIAHLPTAPDEADPEADLLRRAETLFDAARRHSAAGCLVALPGGSLRSSVVQQWSTPEVRIRDGAFPPDTVAPLAFHGFVDAAVIDILDAALEAQAKVTVAIESQTRNLDDGNIVGRIPGDDDTGHVVLVMAHWDAGALSPPLPKGGGAVDNGSGLASLFALAEISGRWYALGRRPRRSIVFAATAAGSIGHLGSAEILRLPGLTRDNIVAVINLEELDWKSTPLEALDGERSDLGASLLELDPTLASRPASKPHGHTPFLRQGIAAVTLRRPPHTLEAGPSEEWGSLERLARDAEIAFRLAWSLAEGTTLPSFHPSAQDVGTPAPETHDSDKTPEASASDDAD